MKNIFLLLLVIFDNVNSQYRKSKEQPWETEHYKYMNYQEMRTKIYELKNQYPLIMKVETSLEKYGIEHVVQCGDEMCVLDIITISDFQAPSSVAKVQVYISGALHGDEVIGPHSAYYLLEYLLSGFTNNDPNITNLLQNREIIVTPMTNAVGFYHNEREERINTNHPSFKDNTLRVHERKVKASVDINRDFPYNTQKDNCLNTIAGRVVHQIFTQNIIVSSITFHGGINVIGYPWGSFNRVSQVGNGQSFMSNESPDYHAFQQVGQLLKRQSGGVIQMVNEQISEYIFGDISSTIYPVNGGLEDWAYAAGWDYFGEDSTLLKCEPYTYVLPPSIIQSADAYAQVRSAIFIVETDNNKRPPENQLGSRQVKRSGRINTESVMRYNSEHDGHINRNIRISMALIEASQPYIEIVSYNQSTEGNVTIKWRVNGCYKLNEAYYTVGGNKQSMLGTSGGQCNMMGEQSVFTVEASKNDSILFQAVVDQEFGESVNPSKVDPYEMANKPQLHMSKMRLNEEYYVQNKDRTLNTSRTLRLTTDQYLKNLERLKETKTTTQSEPLERLHCKLTTIQNYLVTGVFTLSRTDNHSSIFQINGQLNRLPLTVNFQVLIMEYGDLSSLVVEYPDYNSLGKPILNIERVSINKMTNEAVKLQKTLTLPDTVGNFSELAGRALIITTMDGDLVAYGILVNDLPMNKTTIATTNGIAMCENMQSTVQYRAIFELTQTDSNVSFTGFLRTSTKMAEDDELIVSLNGNQQFDLDFESAYQSIETEENYYQYWHACYRLNAETVSNQDFIIGKDLEMYGQNAIYAIGATNTVKILDISKCHIGTRNPSQRLSDESFCRQPLSHTTSIPRDYTYMSVVNFFMIGLMSGIILSFIVYCVQKGQTNMHAGREERKLRRIQEKRDLESIDASYPQKINHHHEGYAVGRGKGQFIELTDLSTE